MATITVLDSAGASQTINEPNANGQATMANSAPVVIASDQGTLPTNDALLAASDLSQSAFLSSSASGENATPLIAAGGAGVTTRVHRMRVTAAGATTVTFLDGSAGSILYTLEFPAAGAYVLDFSNRPYLKTSANKAVVLSSSAAVKVTAGAAYVAS